MTKKQESNKLFTLEELEQLLIYFSTAMFEKNEEDEVLWDIAQNCISKLGFVDCVVYLLDEEKGVLIQKAAIGAKNPNPYQVLNPIEIPLGYGITGTVAMLGEAEVISDTRKDSRYVVDDQPRLSEIAVPILLKNKVVGLIDSEHPEVNYFTSQHLRILKAVASMGAVRIARIRAEKQIVKEQDKLLKAQEQLMELRSQALKSQMNPHFVFNSLNGIQHYIMNDDKKTAIKYLSLFGKLIRYHLKNYEVEVVSLNEELQMLEWYFKLQKLRYEENFNYKWDINLNDSLWNIKIPGLILAAIFEGAVESTVVQKIGQGVLEVQVNINEKVEITLYYRSLSNQVDRSHFFVDYREEMIPWKEQINWHNQIRPYQIEEQTHLVQDENGRWCGVRTILYLPIL